MFRGRVGHHGYLELGHVLQLLVRLNALLETVDFLLKLKVFVREEGCAWRTKNRLNTILNEDIPLSFRLKELF